MGRPVNDRFFSERGSRNLFQLPGTTFGEKPIDGIVWEAFANFGDGAEQAWIVKQRSNRRFRFVNEDGTKIKDCINKNKQVEDLSPGECVIVYYDVDESIQRPWIIHNRTFRTFAKMTKPWKDRVKEKVPGKLDGTTANVEEQSTMDITIGSGNYVDTTTAPEADTEDSQTFETTISDGSYDTVVMEQEPIEDNQTLETAISDGSYNTVVLVQEPIEDNQTLETAVSGGSYDLTASEQEPIEDNKTFEVAITGGSYNEG